MTISPTLQAPSINHLPQPASIIYTDIAAEATHNHKVHKRATASQDDSNIQETRTSSARSTTSDRIKPAIAQKPSAKTWLILVLACILLCGNYYCYDIPASISTSLQQYMKYSDSKWNYILNMLYSVYSIPNLVLPIFSGVLIDKLGTNRTLILFSVVVLIGQTMFTIATHYKYLPLMLTARALFGVGGEALEIAQAVIVTHWFPSNAGLALGLTLTAARLSTAANDNLSPTLFKATGTPDAPNLFGLLVSFTSVLAGLIIVWMTAKSTRDAASPGDDLEGQPLLAETSLVDSQDTHEEISPTRSKWSFDVHPAFWPLCAACILCYATVNPYIHILQGYLEKKYYPGDPILAARVMSIPDLMSSLGSPLVGFLLDRYGYRALSLPVSSFLILAVHVTVMNTTGGTPIPYMLLLGVAYSIFGAALWPCVPGLVRHELRATAYGVMTVAMNIALVGAPMVVGWLVDRGGHWQMELGFCIGSVAAAFAGATVFVMDYRSGKRLWRAAAPDE